jgi:hypothetical protein
VSIHEPRPVAAHGPEHPAADGSALRERVLSLRLPQQQAKAQAAGGSKAVWALVVVLAAVIGVLVYFLLQKKESAETPSAVAAKASADCPPRRRATSRWTPKAISCPCSGSSSVRK